jgi:hypothetical protein
VTDYEAKILIDAVTMLNEATSNSLDPQERQRWSAERDRISRELWRMSQ